MQSVKEFQEMTNNFFVDQADTKADFVVQSQQKAVEMIPQAPAAEEEAAEETEEAAEEQAE